MSTIDRALQQWSTVSGGIDTFRRVTTGGDVQISFAGREANPDFGTQLGVAGFAGYPNSSLQGVIALDIAESWTPDLLLAVTLHEAGHCLGIAHDTVRTSLMHPRVHFASYNLAPGVIVNIDPASREALLALYGWRQLIRLSDRATADCPALGTTTSRGFTWNEVTLHMAWRGSRDDKRIWNASLINNVWTPQAPVPDAFSSSGPALAQIDDSRYWPYSPLLMAWRGVNDDRTLRWKMRIGDTWDATIHIPTSASTHGPALVYWPERNCAVMAWKGAKNDSTIWYSFLSGASWSPQHQHRAARTSNSPALAILNGTLYMFWKGPDEEAGIWYSSLGQNDGTTWGPQYPVMYHDINTSGTVLHPVGTSSSPDATTRGNRIILTWKGAGDDQRIWFTSFDGSSFGGQMTVPGSLSSHGPAICTAGPFTHVAHKSSGDVNTLWWRAL